MPLQRQDLMIGNCYLAHDGQVRSIEALTARAVVYRPREGEAGRHRWIFSESVKTDASSPRSIVRCRAITSAASVEALRMHGHRLRTASRVF